MGSTEVYDTFAKDTYETVHKSIQSSLSKTNGPIFVFVGEEHQDSDYEKNLNATTHTKEQEPAIAAAYTEISALKSAIEQVGKDQVVFSIELPAYILSNFQKIINDNKGKVPTEGAHGEAPMFHTLAYAMKQGIKVVPTDPLGAPSEDAINNDEREIAMQLSIGSLAETENPPRIVVHLGGSAHISNFQGHSNEKIFATNGNPTATAIEKTPIQSAYQDTLYINTARFSPSLLEKVQQSPSEMDQKTLAEHRYFTNPQNAIQIDAPGSIPYKYKHDIGERIENAARHMEKTDSPEPQTAPENAPLTPQ